MKKILFGLVILMLASTAFAFESNFSQTNYSMQIKFYQGWNLVNGGILNEFHIIDNQITTDTCGDLTVYNYLQESKEYQIINLNKNSEGRKLGSMLSGGQSINPNLGLNSGVWVYSKEVCEVDINLFSPRSYNHSIEEKDLKKGWNFIGTSPSFIGKKVTDLTNCKIEKMYSYFDASWAGKAGEWIEEYSDSIEFTNETIGKGYIIKVKDNCVFGKVQESGPPTLPN